MEHETISRAEAKAKGLKFYFTGKPCRNGGIGLRRVSNGVCVCLLCVKKKSDGSRSFYERNSEEIRAKVSRYRSNNLEKIRASERAYGRANKEKRSEYHRQWRSNNPEKVRDCARRWGENNPEKVREKSRRWREDNPELAREQRLRWLKENPGKVMARASKRRAAKRQAIPAWFSEWDGFAIEEAYDLAAQRSEETGIDWHVDHMIPLRARKACGLHCAGNIQVIPAAMNLSKSNKMLLTEPLAWLR